MPKIAFDEASYQGEFLKSRSARYGRYPRTIQIETLVICNASCHFCPYPTFDRKGDRMSDALLKKLLLELREIPPTHPFTLIPHSINEPFLDTRVWDVMENALRDNPGLQVSMTTNVSALNAANIERLNRLAVRHGRLKTVVLSLNEYRREAYETLMGIPFARTMANARRLHDLKQQGTLAFHVHLSRVGDGTEHDAAFLQWCAEEFPAFTRAVSPRVDWIGAMDVGVVFDVPDVACHHWLDLAIKADGIVSLCCADAIGNWPVGDVNSQHLLDVYNSPSYRRFREDFETRRDVDPCRGCPYV